MTRGKQRSGCPVNKALEVLGDRWSLLIVRDMLLKGSRHYKEFLEADEAISTNILADRLQRLERERIVVRERDPASGRRVRYRLTAKGQDLLPVILELVAWSGRHQKPAAISRAFLKRLRDDREALEREIRERS